MIYRIYAQKDTFITDYQFRGIPRTGSNFGASEILELFKQAGISGAVGVPATASLSRIISQFDLGGFSSVPDGASYFLRLADCQHKGTLPSSYDVEVQALSQSWDEGRGVDTDVYSDKGFANWDKSKSDTFWDIPGGTTVGPISVAHFDDGHEDLLVEVTDIVSAWLSGGFPNNGFMVRLSSSLEADSNSYYKKMFTGRETFFLDKRPYLEARWNDFVADDRNDFVFDVSGTLFMYHTVRGQLTDLPSIGTGSIGVKVSDLSGTLAFVTGSHTGRTGTYSASFLIPTGSYSGSLWQDVWFDLNDPNSWFLTSSFGIGNDENRPDITPKRYYVSVVNLQDTYQVDETVRMNMFVRPNDYNPARVLTASLDAHGTVIPMAYYRITNDRTDEVVVPFGTGSLQHTRMSYDDNGNYFTFFMGSLSPGNVYRLSFLFDVDGQRQYVDQNLKFRVV